MKYQRSGLEHLESDTELYNLLVAAKESGDKILKLYNIKYMDKSFATEPLTQELNNIYVIRLQSVLVDRGEHFQVFNARVNLVLAIREYDNITAQQLLKSTYKRIMFHIVNNEIISFLSVNSIDFEYKSPGILDRLTIELTVKEVEDFDYKINEAELYQKLGLGIETTVDNENKWKGDLK